MLQNTASDQVLHYLLTELIGTGKPIWLKWANERCGAWSIVVSTLMDKENSNINYGRKATKENMYKI